MEKIKPILSFIKENFTILVIAFLILFLWSQGCFTRVPGSQQPQIIEVHDTTIIEHKTTLVSQPREKEYVPYPVEKITKEILTDTAYVKQLLQDYLSTRIQKDTLKIDSIGQVDITTYTTKNKVDSVKWNANIKERTITNTITIKEPYKPRNQLFYGGELSSPLGTTLGIQQAQVGIILKNKKDNLFKLSYGHNFQTNSQQLSLGYYKKF